VKFEKSYDNISSRSKVWQMGMTGNNLINPKLS